MCPACGKLTSGLSAQGGTEGGIGRRRRREITFLTARLRVGGLLSLAAGFGARIAGSAVLRRGRMRTEGSGPRGIGHLVHWSKSYRCVAVLFCLPGVSVEFVMFALFAVTGKCALLAIVRVLVSVVSDGTRRTLVERSFQRAGSIDLKSGIVPNSRNMSPTFS